MQNERAEIEARIRPGNDDIGALAENALEVIQTLGRLKPSSSKGTYIKSITLSSTMSPAVPVDSQVNSAS